MKKKTAIASIAALLAVAAAPALADDGNRYNKERHYHSEISAAQAFREMNKGKWTLRGQVDAAAPVLVDVRRLREYAAGHPVVAYNVPYPHIVGSDGDADYLPQDPASFYWEVFDIVEGDTERLVMLLCRTGSRSVDAGNLLSDPAAHGINGPAFSNVRNIWEGFVGQYKYAYSGGDITLNESGAPIRLDLDNDGEIATTDTADVYQETTDANPDKDGWRNFQNLPWTPNVRWYLAYQNNPALYWEWMTPVE